MVGSLSVMPIGMWETVQPSEGSEHYRTNQHKSDLIPLGGPNDIRLLFSLQILFPRPSLE